MKWNKLARITILIGTAGAAVAGLVGIAIVGIAIYLGCLELQDD